MSKPNPHRICRQVSVVKNTTVNIHGYDKEVVGQFAATIR